MSKTFLKFVFLLEEHRQFLPAFSNRVQIGLSGSTFAYYAMRCSSNRKKKIQLSKSFTKRNQYRLRPQGNDGPITIFTAPASSKVFQPLNHLLHFVTDLSTQRLGRYPQAQRRCSTQNISVPLFRLDLVLSIARLDDWNII